MSSVIVDVKNLTKVYDGKEVVKSISFQPGLIGIWFVIIYFIAFRVFRWE